MAVLTARDLITASLKRLGVLSGIEVPTADLASDALDRLNALLEQWGTESLVVWTQATVALTPLVAGKSVYTIGVPGGDLLIPPPPWIDGASLLLPGPPGYEAPLQVLTSDEWQDERVKTLTTSYPTAIYYNPKLPLAELRLWPVFSGGEAQGVGLYVPTPINSAMTLDTVLSLPAGYKRALRDELAVELGPEVGRQDVGGGLRTLAAEAKAQIKRVNHRPDVLRTSLPWCGGAYDWRIDR